MKDHLINDKIPHRPNTINTLFSDRNFLLHWFSSFMAHVGGYFTAVALPWLVLGMTDNDPVIMTRVLATLTLPHSVFILFGGAIVDRLSPIKVLYWSRLLFIVVMLMLAVQVYTQAISLWALYVYAALLGSIGAFGIPASQAFLPLILKDQKLAKGNAFMMGSLQVAQMLGPFLAGWLIWGARTLRSIPNDQFDYQSLGIAFLIDALLVSVAWLCLLLINVGRHTPEVQNLKLMVAQGLKFCWRDSSVRLTLGYLALVSFCLHGVLMASLPIYTKLELGLPASAYGSLYAMLGLGTVIGAVVAAKHVHRVNTISLIMLNCDLVIGICFFSFGAVGNVWLGAILLVAMGVCSGVVMVLGTTWFQFRTPKALMGRVMSILMFCVIGLIPLSAIAAGGLIDAWGVASVMRLAGLIIAVFAIVGLLTPNIRTMSQRPPITP